MMKKLTETWKQQKYGTVPGSGLQNIRKTSDTPLNEKNVIESYSRSYDRGVARKRLGRIPITKSKDATEHVLHIKPNGQSKANYDEANPQIKEKQHDLSFASSFFTDMDAEMFDVMEKMEQNIENDATTPKSNTPKRRTTSNKNTICTTPRSNNQLTFDTPKQNNGKRLKGVCNESPAPKSGKRLCTTDENLPKQQSKSVICKQNKSPDKQQTVNSIGNTGIALQDREVNKILDKKLSKVTSQDKNKKLISKQEVVIEADVHDVSWQSPQVASTPQESTNAVVKSKKSTAKQTHLFKSLFTLQSPMNISGLDDSLLSESKICEDDTNKRTKKSDLSVKRNLIENSRIFESETSKHENDNVSKEKSAGKLFKNDSNAIVQSSDKDSLEVNRDQTNHNNNNSVAPCQDGERRTLDNQTNEELKLITSGNQLPVDLMDDNNERLLLGNWGLPDPVLQQYHNKGITTMFPWQAECLCTGKVLAGENLVYSAPTSAGKTMVAELLVLKRVMETKKKAIIILPFVSVAREKMLYLQQLYQDAGIRVGGFMGSYSPAGGFNAVDVAVCTIEKGNSLINRLLENNKLDELGIIVVDELHLVGDSHRGYLLELLLTKIHYVSQKEIKDKRSTKETGHHVQVVGMSATLPNLDLLAKWLNAQLFHTDFRPVPLKECVKIGTTVFDSTLTSIRDIDLTLTFKSDADYVIPLCLETLKNGHSVLIFCPTKNWCEKLSETIAKEFYGLLKNMKPIDSCDNGSTKPTDLFTLPLNRQGLMDVVEQLRRSPAGLDITLGRTIPYGVAFHHAGLTFDERDIVEGAFRQCLLKILIATSTLSSGVNLPARRVIIRTPIFHGKTIDFLTYKQMIGRAGRKGVDTEGESILICKPNERSKAVTLVTSSLTPVHSCLVQHDGGTLSSSMKRAVLEIVVSGVATLPEDVAMYASCTLLAASVSENSDQINELTSACINFLHENEFVSLQKVKNKDGSEDGRFCPTQLGSAVLASALSPDEGLVVFAELQKARQCFVLENELHIIYLVTPIYAMDLGKTMDWYQFYCQWERLSPGERRVAELVGVTEGFLTKAIRGRIPIQTTAQVKALSVHKRFYTCLILHDLVNEVPLSEVARKYNCNKGQLQSLQQSAASFAGMVTVFCARLGWSNLELILGQFQNRLTFGIQRELCDLVRLTLLNGQRARVLYNGGFQTVASLANANPEDVEAIFKNSSPFQSSKRQDNETEWEAAQRRESRCIWLTGRRGVTEHEAAIAVIEEAKCLVREELGGIGIQWKKHDEKNLSGEKSDFNKSNESVKSEKSTIDHNVSLPTGSIHVIGPRTSHSLNKSMKKLRRRTGSGRRCQLGRKSLSPGYTQINSESKRNSNVSGLNVTCSKNMFVVVSPPLQKVQTSSACTDVISATDCPVDLKSYKAPVQNSNASVCRLTGVTLVPKQRPCQILSNSSVTVKQKNCNETKCDDPTEGRVNDTGENPVSTEQNMNKKLHVDEQFIAEIDKYTEEMFDDSVDDRNTKVENEVDDEMDKKMLEIKHNAFKVAKTGAVPNDSSMKDRKNIEKFSQEEFAPLDKKNEPRDTCGHWQSFEDKNIGEKTVTPTNKAEKEKQNTCEIKSCNEEFTDSFLVNTQVNQIVDLATEGTVHSEKIVDLGTKTAAHSEKIAGESDIRKTYLGEQKSPELYTEDMNNSNMSTNCQRSVIPMVEDKHVLKTVAPSNSLHEVTHNTSVELISASDFDTCNFSTESVLDNSSVQLCPDDSYKDLHIPYHSGQEACFSKNDSPKCVNLQEDLAIALDMNDTFTCTNILEAESTEKGVNKKNITGDLLPQSQTNTKTESSGRDVNKKKVTRAPLPQSQTNTKTESLERDVNKKKVTGAPLLQSQTNTKTESSERDVNKKKVALPQSQTNTKAKTIETDVNNKNATGTSLTLFQTKAESSEKTVNKKKVTGATSCSSQKIAKVKSIEKNMNIKKVVGASLPPSQTKAEEMNDSITFSMMENILENNIADSPISLKCFDAQGDHDDLNNRNNEAVRQEDSNVQFTKLKNKTDSDKNLQGETFSKNKPKRSSSSRQNKLSPGTLAFLDDLQTNGITDIKSPPRRGGKTPSKTSSIKDRCESEKDINSVSNNTRSKQKRKSDESENLPYSADTSKAKHSRKKSSNSTLNQSNESDCLPPTPPGDKTCNSPLLSFKKVTPLKGKTPVKSKGTLIPGMIANSTNVLLVKEGISAPPENEIGHRSDNNVDISDDDYTEREPCIDPNESGISSSQELFTIIDVCADKRLFDTFVKEWRTKTHYSISIACEKRPLEHVVGGGIGGNFVKGSSSYQGTDLSALGLAVEGMDLLVAGIAVCWENRDSYYVAFTPENSKCELDDSLAPPPLDESISVTRRISCVQSILQQGLYKDKVISIIMFDTKTAYSVLVRGCGISPRGKFHDPKIACWLLDPGAKEKNLHRMLHNYLPLEANLLEGIGGGFGYGSLGMTPENLGSGRLRATIESVVILHLMDYFIKCLVKEELCSAFHTIEMPSIITLARMELNGFGFSDTECESQKNIMLAQLSALEDQAYQIAGHQFSLTATDDIAQVLFIELQLPPNGDPNSIGQPRSLGQRRTAVGRKGRQKCTFSTSKDVLEKLKPLHPLPGIILEWRRISSALTKVVFPLQKEKVLVEGLDMYRIFTECQFHTATGRVSMSEPNLQNVPKDFEISLPDIIGESPVAETGITGGKKTRGGNSKLNQMIGSSRQKSKMLETGSTHQFSVSMRHAFVPFQGGVMLAADYSQLELRMIAHLSQDAKLMKILNDDGDVFKMIAAQWKCTVSEAVTPEQRQQAKQVCYGMIYGIGPKALGEQLNVEENDAAAFIETFKARYPGMRTYLRKTVESCKDKGYVQTILKRKRFLPTISSTNTYIRAHAERQAVNTTVQGSAADLVKCAMNHIDVKLSDAFPQTFYTHRQKRISTEDHRNRKTGLGMPRGCYLVLQLHDELIYEVAQDDLIEAAHIIKYEMENAMKLAVRLPVKVKAGPSWGKLEDLEL